MATPTTLGALLAQRTKEGVLYEKLENRKVRCFACGHRCLVSEGREGICKVRFNENGVLRVPTGYVGALQCDPIEKKPFFHAFPGEDALSFGMLGCDLHCAYCQNWFTSQALRDPASIAPPEDVTPESLVRIAVERGAPVVASTYNEPLITSEWAVDVFRAARASGLRCAYISNGNGTPQVLEYLRPWVDLYKVDLKGFDDKGYRRLGGVLQNVLETIRSLVRMGFWTEIVTLVVPGFNDSDDELKALADFLVGVSPDLPWHITAFHPDYKMTDRDATRAERLVRAAEMGERAGLRYVYAGNAPGQVGEFEHTRCPGCRKAVVRRYGYRVLSNNLTRAGACDGCGARVAGYWWGEGAKPPHPGGNPTRMPERVAIPPGPLDAGAPRPES
ncbi:MAG: AmmeMemoRadiSam system radical SAM enzyme [Planctomycetes bacterium]|nr:AmmeMemoRadiSam system radical SAM enzyme [Planctomycetota bacterium]